MASTLANAPSRARDDEATSTEAEVEPVVERRARLEHQISAGDASVGRASVDQLGDVLGAHEDGRELVAELGGEGALTRGAHLEPSRVEELDDVGLEPTLVGERDAKHGGTSRDDRLLGEGRTARAAQRAAAASEGEVSSAVAHVTAHGAPATRPA
jgi:hypothetical protein